MQTDILTQHYEEALAPVEFLAENLPVNVTNFAIHGTEKFSLAGKFHQNAGIAPYADDLDSAYTFYTDLDISPESVKSPMKAEKITLSTQLKGEFMSEWEYVSPMRLTIHLSAPEGLTFDSDKGEAQRITNHGHRTQFNSLSEVADPFYSAIKAYLHDNFDFDFDEDPHEHNVSLGFNEITICSIFENIASLLEHMQCDDFYDEVYNGMTAEDKVFYQAFDQRPQAASSEALEFEPLFDLHRTID